VVVPRIFFFCFSNRKQAQHAALFSHSNWGWPKIVK